MVLPNGSRLSCGASAGGRKHPVLRYEVAGAQTYGAGCHASRCGTLGVPPNQRLKLAGGDRSKGSGVLCAGGRVARSLSAIR